MTPPSTHLPPPKSFRLFSRLPIAVRHAIYKLAAHFPRNIDLNLRPGNVDDIDYSSSTPPPAVLHTSYEARQEGLKWYKSGLPKSPGMRHVNDRTDHPSFYLNWKVDRLCLLGSGAHESQRTKIILRVFLDCCMSQGLRSLAMSLSLHLSIRDYAETLQYLFQVQEINLFSLETGSLLHVHRNLEFIDSAILKWSPIEYAKWKYLEINTDLSVVRLENIIQHLTNLCPWMELGDEETCFEYTKVMFKSCNWRKLDW